MNSSGIKIFGIILMVGLLIYITFTRTKDSSTDGIMSNEEIYDYIVDLWAYFENKSIDEYTEEQLVVISVTAYDGEMNNGGINQFLTNSSKDFIPMLSNSLKQIKAEKHKKQFDELIKQNNIDINNLEEVTIENEEEFDSEFYDLEQSENLYNLTIEYAKKNYDKIIN